MAADLPPILFPRRPVAPWRALGRRLGVAVGIVVVVTLLTYLGRDGYRDADGDPVTVLDSLYYASVTLTTTGYGDITPISPGARAVAAFVLTPLRILFLIALVGTTLELLTERFRAARAESRWRSRVSQHTVVVGYGTKGRWAVASVLATGTPKEQIVVVEAAPTVITEAQDDGLTVVQGDATRTVVLQHARVDEAASVIVTPRSDDTATLVTLTARELAPHARIVAAVRESENAHLLRQSGADNVIVSAEASGRMLGLSITQPASVCVLEDLLIQGDGLGVVERPASPEEVGGAPVDRPGERAIAVVRDGTSHPFGTPAFGAVAAGDVVVSVATS